MRKIKWPSGFITLAMYSFDYPRQRLSVDNYFSIQLNACSQHMNWSSEMNWPSYMTRSLVTRVSVMTKLAAAKLGRSVLSQFVRCEHSHWKVCVQNSSSRTPVQFSSCTMNRPIDYWHLRTRSSAVAISALFSHKKSQVNLDCRTVDKWQQQYLP